MASSTPPLIADSEKALFMADLRTFLLIVVFSFQFAITSAQVLSFNFSCSEKSAHSESIQYQHNLDRLLQELNYTGKAFDNSTVGGSPYQVYGLYLCRGDATDQLCQSCVYNATSTINSQCPYSAGALFFYDYCMFRYSNVSFFGKLDFSVSIYMWNVDNITGTSVGSFEQVVIDTFKKMAFEAAKGNRLGQMFATKETNYTAESGTLYELGQCTPDLYPSDCDTCLTECIGLLPSCCRGKQGGRVLFPSCNIRYEIYPFYANAAASAPPDRPPPAIVAGKFGRTKAFQLEADLVSRMAMIVGYMHLGHPIKALMLLVDEWWVGIVPNSVPPTSVLSASTPLGHLKMGKTAHYLGVVTASSLMDKQGRKHLPITRFSERAISMLLLSLSFTWKARGDHHRNVCSVLVSAYGTNLASAARCGMNIVAAGSETKGHISIDESRTAAVANKDNLSTLMVTYLSTQGVYEEAGVPMENILYLGGPNIAFQIYNKECANVRIRGAENWGKPLANFLR
ncbi:hypothetical protein Nepgr_021306 [Nepenthes gracilis]|uniref:Gnk2-homologous domain-containing protein n=1 Tax=Nepenthes gracilis TaxID=150966 RepID=A0AAD3SYE3_NEPGR|nr:hypothetical protein Nepgr_021306 [Nepenthes gracilis]